MPEQVEHGPEHDGGKPSISTKQPALVHIREEKRLNRSCHDTQPVVLMNVAREIWPDLKERNKDVDAPEDGVL
jgi:hypothetical protein